MTISKIVLAFRNAFISNPTSNTRGTNATWWRSKFEQFVWVFHKKDEVTIWGLDSMTLESSIRSKNQYALNLNKKSFVFQSSSHPTDLFSVRCWGIWLFGISKIPNDSRLNSAESENSTVAWNKGSLSVWKQKKPRSKIRCRFKDIQKKF